MNQYSLIEQSVKFVYKLWSQKHYGNSSSLKFIVLFKLYMYIRIWCSTYSISSPATNSNNATLMAFTMLLSMPVTVAGFTMPYDVWSSYITTFMMITDD